MKQATVQTVYEWVDRLAPFETAMEWDNVGLLLGARERPVDTVLTALDLTPGVIEEAVGLGAQVVVTHHPMLAPLRRLDEAEPQAALLCAAVRAGISWIAAHTNLDMAEGGVNDALAERLGWQVTETDGFLRVGNFEAPRALEAVREEVERALGWPVWRFGPAGAKVRRFALCSGSGGSEVQSALRHGAQLFLTGEVRHDAALRAVSQGLQVLAAGHGATEKCAANALQKHLQSCADAVQSKVRVFVSRTNPFA